MIAEPIIYLVVWSTVAVQQGGEVGGYTPNEFAAYYIVWTLVRNMNVTSVGAWEGHIREGDLSRMLLHPIHPVHWDIGYFAGWKLVMIVMWLPVAVVLSLLFRPMFSVEPIDVAVFAVAIWGAYAVRSLHLLEPRDGRVLDDADGPDHPGRDDLRAAVLRAARAAVADAGLGPAAGGRAAVQVDVRVPDRGADRADCRWRRCSADSRCRRSGS